MQGGVQMGVWVIAHGRNRGGRFAGRICVMRHGELGEQGRVQERLARPQHPYTRQLLASEPPRLVDEGLAGEIAQQPPVMEGARVHCYFPIKAGFFRRQVGEVKAVDDVDVSVRPGETVGIVGESGSGKSTLGMCLLQLQRCDGEIRFEGRRLDGIAESALRPLRRNFQVVFQDPFSSLSPRMTVEEIVGEGLRLHFPELNRQQRRERIVAVLEEVGLDAAMIWRYPHEFSGGQRQRIAIARAMVLEPKLVLLDEPTSALDVSVQKQVLELLRDLQRRHSISYLFISHDLKVVRAVSHRVMVMRAGRVVEAGPTEQLFENPRHEYTRTLLNAALFRSGDEVAAGQA